MSDELMLMCEFPNLAPPKQFKITSPRSKTHNCIAFAADDQHRKWWPDKMGVDHWPDGVQREATLEAFVAAFRTLGYELCDSSEPEVEFEKIAIFTKPAGTPAHAAKQCDNGLWRSKLGDSLDIEHELDGVEGTKYGKAAKFMKRSVRVK